MSRKLFRTIICGALVIACSPTPTDDTHTAKPQSPDLPENDVNHNDASDGDAQAERTDDAKDASNKTNSDSLTDIGIATDASRPIDSGVIDCTPETYQCNGTVLAQCNLKGDAWKTIVDCKTGTLCDATLGKCVCQIQCADKACGDDGCGGSCGQCNSWAQCNEGKCGTNCVAAGTGKQVGYKAQDISWTTSDNKPFNLHSVCGTKKATIVFQTAGW